MIKFLKKLFGFDKEPDGKEGGNKEDILFDIYILDSNKDAHYVAIHNIDFDDDGKMKLTYTSSSDIMGRGLLPELERAIKLKFDL